MVQRVFPIGNMDEATLLGWGSPPQTSCPQQAVAHFSSSYRHSPTHQVACLSGSNRTQSPPNGSSLPPLADHRGSLSGSACCGGLRLPALQVGLGIACFPFLAARVQVQLQHHRFSGLAGVAALGEEATPGPLLFAGGVSGPLLTPARHSRESCPSPSE